MTHRSSSFHYFQPSKNVLCPHTTVWLHVPEMSQVPNGRGNRGAPGHPQDFSLPLRFPGTTAEPTHGVSALLQRAPCIPTSWGCVARGRQVPRRRAAQGCAPVGVRWHGDQGLCAAAKMTLIFFHPLAKVRWWEGQRRSQST